MERTRLLGVLVNTKILTSTHRRILVKSYSCEEIFENASKGK
jgi:hypothetical protein